MMLRFLATEKVHLPEVEQGLDFWLLKTKKKKIKKNCFSVFLWKPQRFQQKTNKSIFVKNFNAGRGWGISHFLANSNND